MINSDLPNPEAELESWAETALMMPTPTTSMLVEPHATIATLASLPHTQIWLHGDVGSGVTAVADALGHRLANSTPPAALTADGAIVVLRTAKLNDDLRAHFNACDEHTDWDETIRNLPTGGAYLITTEESSVLTS